MMSLLLPLRRSVLAAHFCPPSSRSARRPSSSLLQPHDFRLPLITPLDCPQLPATLRPGADLVPIPFCCSSTWTLGCGGKVMEGARPGCAIAAQQRVLAFRPSSSSLERLAGVLCCLDLSLPLGAIRRARFDDLSRSEYNYPPRFLSAWGKRPYRPSRLTSPLPSVCLFAGASSLLPRLSSPTATHPCGAHARVTGAVAGRSEATASRCTPQFCHSASQPSLPCAHRCDRGLQAMQRPDSRSAALARHLH